MKTKMMLLALLTIASVPITTKATPNGTIHGAVTSMPVSSAANAVVYLDHAPNTDPVSAPVLNRQMSFSPYINVISVGGTATFVNMDPFPHNVFSLDNEKFDIGLLQTNKPVSKTFTHTGVYVLLCNLHPNMKAYLVVTPTGYFAKTDTKGNFSINDVAPGKYSVTAWAPSVKSETRVVTVKDDITANFSLHR